MSDFEDIPRDPDSGPLSKVSPDSIRQYLGIETVLSINLYSTKLKRLTQVKYSAGCNVVPSAADFDRVLIDAIEDVNKRFGTDDYRLTHLGDFGFERNPLVEWPPHPDAARPGEIAPDRADITQKDLKIDGQ